MNNEQKKEFENRNSDKINQRILKVEEIIKNEYGEISELIVSVERCDDPNTDDENPDVKYTGTPLEANSLNEIIREMILEIKQESEVNLDTEEDNANTENEEE